MLAEGRHVAGHDVLGHAEHLPDIAAAAPGIAQRDEQLKVKGRVGAQLQHGVVGGLVAGGAGGAGGLHAQQCCCKGSQEPHARWC